MNYYLDTEFDGFGGRLLSMALVSTDGHVLYLVDDDLSGTCEWVSDNVIPIMHQGPVAAVIRPVADWPAELSRFFAATDGSAAHIISDWPDDVKYFCQSVITGPGTMIGLKALSFEVVRVDAYPTDMEGAVQHNALWDALALREKLKGGDA